MSNFLAFLSGAAKKATADIDAHNKLNEQIKLAAYEQALEAHEEEKSKFGEIQRVMESQQNISPIMAKLSGLEWKDMSVDEKNAYLEKFDTEEGRQAVLDAYNPGDAPNLDNYGDKLKKHPLIEYVKDKTGLTPNTSYARQKEYEGFVAKNIDLGYESVKPIEEDEEGMDLQVNSPTMYVLAKMERGEEIDPRAWELVNNKLAGKEGKTTYVNLHNKTTDQTVMVEAGSPRAEQLMGQGWIAAGKMNLNRGYDVEYKELAGPALTRMNNFLESTASLEPTEENKDLIRIAGALEDLKKEEEEAKEPRGYSQVMNTIIEKYSTKYSTVTDQNERWNRALMDTLQGVTPGKETKGLMGVIDKVFGSEGASFKTDSRNTYVPPPKDSTAALNEILEGDVKRRLRLGTAQKREPASNKNKEPGERLFIIVDPKTKEVLQQGKY